MYIGRPVVMTLGAPTPAPLWAGCVVYALPVKFMLGLLIRLVGAAKPFDAARLLIVLVVMCSDGFEAMGGEKPRIEFVEVGADCAMCIMLSRRMIIDGRRRWNFCYCQLRSRSPKIQVFDNKGGLLTYITQHFRMIQP